MENPNFSRNRNGGEHLGVNKMGKNIKKSPIHQPNFGNAKQQPQPQVYNISKNDFRNVVQRLTGSPSQDPLPRPPHNPPKHPSMRLQKIRPPPLTPMNRPQIPPPPALAHFNNSVVRPGSIGQPSVSPLTTHIPGNPILANTAESPISAYMRDLNSIIEWDARQTHQAQPQFHAPSQAQGQYQGHPSSAGLLPTPPPAGFPSPRGNFPSPTSQFLLPSPSSYLNLLTPRSPYGLLSPGFQYPPPVTPNFSFSPWSQSGILGPGPQFPPSPAAYFPSSPSGLYPLSSPRWRDP